jgi:hypothetical protein
MMVFLVVLAVCLWLCHLPLASFCITVLGILSIVSRMLLEGAQDE